MVKIISLFEENLKCEKFCLEIQFKSISNEIIFMNLNKILENYQIKIIKIFRWKLCKKFLKIKILNYLKWLIEILNGYNENEVTLIPKKYKKIRFF